MNPDPEYHDRLERLIDLELKRLPQPPVPEPLLERVLRAIEAEQHKPWWRKPWSCWPLAIQIFFMASLLGLAGSLVYALSVAPTDTLNQWVSVKLAGIGSVFNSSASVLMTLLNAFSLVLTSAFQSWALIAIAAVAILYTFSVALGVAWLRVALNRPAFHFKHL